MNHNSLVIHSIAYLPYQEGKTSPIKIITVYNCVRSYWWRCGYHNSYV